MDVEVRAGHLSSGQGFLVAGNVALTALHVIEGVDESSLTVVGNARNAAVVQVLRNEELDVAGLVLDREIGPADTVGTALTDRRWIGSAREGDGSPVLTGVVTAARRPWTSDAGHAIEVVQLRVDQTIGNYGGYSGSAIRATDGTRPVVALLVEQQLLAAIPSHDRVAANVLYAVPIEDAINALGLPVDVDRMDSRPVLPPSMVYHDAMLASLHGYRSRLAKQNLTFVSPSSDAQWHPRTLWNRLRTSESGSLLLTGHGGVGKTRTALEVGDVAAEEGWEVIHVRGVNAAGVADAIAARLSDGHAKPILMLLDYMNLARELDLVALTDMAALDSGGAARLRILATSRSGWESRNRNLPGLDRFSRVLLARSDADAELVCRAIVEQVAPSASRAFSASAVLDLTGSVRPILAVLLGQIVESHYSESSALPAALVSEDLASWLDARLLEDGIIPSSAIDGLDVPIQILIAAVALAAAPAPLHDLADCVTQVVGESRHELVALTIEKLTRIGWLVPTEEGVIPAHDVVVDKIVESAAFHRDSEVARADVVDAMLGVARALPRAFTNVVMALERVLDERSARDLGGESMRFAASRWLENHGVDLYRHLGADAIASARAAVQLLESELWNQRTEDVWPRMAYPLIATIGAGTLAAEPLRLAGKKLPRNCSPNVVDVALAWLDQNDLDEMVLNAYLFRKDLSEQQALRLIAMGVASLEDRYESVTADFTLRRLLMRQELSAGALQTVSEYAGSWLALHRDGSYAVHLLSALIDRTDLEPSLRSEAFDSARAWVAARPTRVEGSYALAALIRHAADLGSYETDVWPLVAAWLGANGAAEDANYVLQALMNIEPSVGDHVNATWSATRFWLQNRRNTSSSSFLLKAVVQWRKLGPELATEVWAIVEPWLSEHRDSQDGDFVIRACLEWDYAVGDIALSLWPHARRWLLARGTRHDATYVLRATIDWKALPNGEAALVWQFATKWFTTVGSDFTATYLMQSLLAWPFLDAPRAQWLWDYLLPWLSINGSRVESSFLYGSLMNWVGLSDARFDELAPHISRWWGAHGEEVASRSFASLLVRSSQSTPGGRDAFVWSLVHGWIRRHASEQKAGALWMDILVWPAMTADRARELVEPLKIWFDANGTHRSRVAVMQRTADSSYFSPAAARVIWPPIAEEVVNHRGGMPASFLLQSLLRWRHLDLLDPDLVVGGVVSWLAADPDGTGAYLIRELAKNRPRAVPEVWGEIVDWLAMYRTVPHAIHAIEPLLAVSGSDDADELWEALEGWLDANPYPGDAFALTTAALTSRGLSPARWDALWPHIPRLLETHATVWGANRLIQSVIKVRPSDEVVSPLIQKATAAWLDQFGTKREASFLLQALLGWQRERLEMEPTLWQRTDRWLDAHGLHPHAHYLLLRACSTQHVGLPEADAVLRRVHAWLVANVVDSQRAAVRLIVAVLESRTFSNNQVARFAELGGAWWAPVVANDRARQEIVMAVRGGAVSGNRRRLLMPHIPTRPARRHARIERPKRRD